MLKTSWKKHHSERSKKQEKMILELIVPQNTSIWELIALLTKLINMSHYLKNTLMSLHGVMMILRHMIKNISTYYSLERRGKACQTKDKDNEPQIKITSKG
jgi:hypothetical protein